MLIAASASHQSPLLEADNSAVPSGRVHLLDNAKALLICCVVLYHTAVVYTTTDRPESPIPLWSGVLMLLKPVVMPGFCVISGHLSRAQLDSKRVRGLCQLFATYALFQVLYYLNNMLAFRLNGFPFPVFPVLVFNPPQQVVTWFLLALTLWRALLPIIVQLHAPRATVLLVALSALFVDVGLNYQNILAFWPYFVVGHYMRPTLWEWLGELRTRLLVGGLFVLISIAIVLFSALGDDGFAQAFTVACATYDCFNGVQAAQDPRACAGWRPLLLRVAFYGCSVPLLLGFLCVVPRRQGIWSLPGYMSMYIYLLHPLVITNPAVMKLAFDQLSAIYGREVNVWSPADGPGAAAMTLPAALCVCTLLSLPWTRTAFRLLVEPPTDRLFRPIPSPA
mmetsp:Transcript_74617/g.124466  ORF Transcript_74617/g.124466 Transcript_74617/m.124466 type:complete len:393 (-) Transcript_74617:181-1359(-)